MKMDDILKYGIKKILVVNLGGIGDLLLSTPALRVLKENYPESEISILVVPRLYEIARDLRYIDQVFIFYKEGYYSLPRFLKNLLCLFRLRRMGFDICLNMRTLVSKKSAKKIKFIFYIIHPRIKAGRDTDGRGWFFDIKIPESLKDNKWEAEYDIKMMEALGIKVSDRGFDFPLDSDSIDNLRRILLRNGVSEKETLVGIHPGGKPSHRWQVQNFIKVIDEISKVRNCRFIITGDNQDLDLTKWFRRVDTVNLIGKLSLKELGALIKRCDLFISNDTGPMHIAAILKTPLIAIFGPGYLSRYDPRHISNKAVVFYKNTICSPCDKLICKTMHCLRDIYPEGVIAKALDFL